MLDWRVRDAHAQDDAAVDAFYPRAFPDEDLSPLLQALRAIPESVTALVADAEGAILGHVAFTQCAVANPLETPVLLGPLAVDPRAQRTGVGGALVREGLARLQAQGATLALVLGDPAYYGRFGFAAEAAIAPPHPIPEKWRPAWQSVRLADAPGAANGVLQVPPAWDKPALWSL